MGDSEKITGSDKVDYTSDKLSISIKESKTKNGLASFASNNIPSVKESTKNDVNNVLESGIGKTPQQISTIIEKVQLGEKLNKSEIDALNLKIISNNPSLGIFDNLKSGDKFTSIIIDGVKGVNDEFSQNFTDSILDTFKFELLKRYPGIIPVWNDYKNFVLKINYGKIPTTKELNTLLNDSYIYKLTKKGQYSANLPKLKTISETGIINGETQKDIMFSLAKTRSNLEGQIHSNNTLSSAELVKKLKEMEDDYSFNGKVNERTNDLRGRTRYVTRRGILHKKYKIGRTGKTVIDRIPILDSKGDLNPKIIKLVRKNKIPSHLQIFKDVKQIINSSIVNGEFIGPYVRTIGLEKGDLINPKLLDKYQIIKDKLTKCEELDNDELESLKSMTQKTYKNAYDKDTFCSKLNKPGELFFIDIAGMGDINIQDFINKIKRYNSLDISRQELLLNSGSYMTENFQNLLIDLQVSLSSLYPGKEINYYIGGDEIGIFIEGENESKDETIRVIYDELDNNLLEGRITKKIINKDESRNNGKKHFDEVDKLTKYSKIIEDRIEEAIQKLKVDAHKTTIHNFSDIISKLNSLKDFDISENKGIQIITFHPENGEQIFEEGNTIDLERIIDLRTLKLKHSPVSPFIDYFINNNLER